MIDRKLSEYFSAMGRKSAKVRMKTVSSKRWKQIARNAAVIYTHQLKSPGHS